MKRCSFCEWIPILPWPVWPLAWQCSLGQNAVVGSMTLLLALRGNIATRSMSGPPFALQRHRTTVWCRAIGPLISLEKLRQGYDFIRQLYDTIIIPPGVLDEVAEGQFATPHAYLQHYGIVDLIEVQAVSQSGRLPE